MRQHTKRLILLLAFMIIVLTVTIGSRQMRMADDKKELFDGFAEMDYALLLETNTGYGMTLNYYRYGIYGNCETNREEGEDFYFALHDKLLGKLPALANCKDNSGNNEHLVEEDIVHSKWADNTEEIITDCSTDMEWVITREYGINCSGLYTERWYHNAELVRKFDGSIINFRQFVQRKTENGSYEPIPQENIDTAEQLLAQYYGWSVTERNDGWFCFDTEGKLMAAADKNEYGQGCGTGINIYSIDEKNGGLLYHLERSGPATKWPIEISQMEGGKNSGWVVFSQGDETYKITYPSGETEKIGEFMYGSTYSPDGKYLAYCTGNEMLYNSWEDMEDETAYSFYQDLRSRWDKIPSGWYIIELETGAKTYIPMPVWSFDSRPLYGGRCVWIEKTKLV